MNAKNGLELHPQKWVDMSYFYPEKIVVEDEEHGFEISHVELSRHQVMMAQLRSRDPWWVYYGLRPEHKYTRLIMNERIMMSDTPMERYTNREFLRSANGRVLIFGLGLGLLLPPMSVNPKIEHITIVEINPLLIDTVRKSLSEHLLFDKVDIMQGDAFTLDLPKSEKFETIYFDIWDSISSDNYPETKDLHKRYRKNMNYKHPDYFIDSWVRDHIRREWYEWN